MLDKTDLTYFAMVVMMASLTVAIYAGILVIA
jgi:hypothetical protein